MITYGVFVHFDFIWVVGSGDCFTVNKYILNHSIQIFNNK